jgi:hypothetical protein
VDKIALRLINQSNDANNSRIVIFQKNVTTNFGELAVAWRVIQNLGQTWTHNFTYSLNMQISVSDSYGNDSPQATADPGQLWHTLRDPSGDQLKLVGNGNTPTEIQVRNDFDRGAIAAVNCYRDGKLLATKTGVSPAQKAVFQFKPTIWVGVVSQIQEGEVMDSAIISDVNTELSLLGVASADIVMAGGGTTSTATAFTFSLANVVRS